MTYRLLALDVDGTLLRRDGSIHESDLAAIERLRASGVPVSIVTGRMYSGTKHVAEAAGIVGPIACVDGSHIARVECGETLVYHPIAGGHAEVLRRIAARCEAASFLFSEDGIAHDEAGSAFAPYVRTWSNEVELVACLTEHPRWEHERGVLGLVSVGTEAAIGGAVEELRAELAGAAVVVSFAVQRLEGLFAMVVRAAGPTKGTAIEWLAAHHGCTPEEVVCVGDWLNDVPMFETAGRSFVMAQAPAAVKRAATDELEADGAEGGGIAEAIARAWGRL